MPKIAALLLTAALTVSAQTKPPTHPLDLTLHTPESAGFSSERLNRLHESTQQTIDQKQIAGMVTLLGRHGKIVDYRAYGVRDLASATPMTKDTIFREAWDFQGVVAWID